jgi:hypothetical protein
LRLFFKPKELMDAVALNRELGDYIFFHREPFAPTLHNRFGGEIGFG